MLTALKKRERGESLKSSALKNGPYAGLQQQIVFDVNGAIQRKVFFTEIRDGRYVHLKQELCRSSGVWRPSAAAALDAIQVLPGLHIAETGRPQQGTYGCRLIPAVL